MSEIRRTNVLVEQILESDAESRNNNDYLYLKVCQTIDPAIYGLSFGTVMQCRGELHLPPFETVVRCRREVQRIREDLRADSNVEAARELKEKEFREFAVKGH